MIEVVAFVAMVLGVLGRAALPYLLKMQAGEVIVWSQRYTASAIASVVLAMIAVALVFSAFTIPEGSVSVVAGAAFAFGWALSTGTAELAKWSTPK